jgi:hypothetical protein
VGRDRLYNDQLADAVFGQRADDIEPSLMTLEVTEDVRDLPMTRSVSAMFHGRIIMEPVPTSRVLCFCGAVVELDRSTVGIKHKLGKTVECRRCRNERVAREKEEEDIAFNGVKEENENW